MTPPGPSRNLRANRPQDHATGSLDALLRLLDHARAAVRPLGRAAWLPTLVGAFAAPAVAQDGFDPGEEPEDRLYVPREAPPVVEEPASRGTPRTAAATPGAAPGRFRLAGRGLILAVVEHADWYGDPDGLPIGAELALRWSFGGPATGLRPFAELVGGFAQLRCENASADLRDIEPDAPFSLLGRLETSADYAFGRLLLGVDLFGRSPLDFCVFAGAGIGSEYVEQEFTAKDATSSLKPAWAPFAVIEAGVSLAYAFGPVSLEVRAAVLADTRPDTLLGIAVAVGGGIGVRL